MLLLNSCHKSSPDSSQPEIAVANSYLHAAVKDLCGDKTQVLDLVPPGMCPGHFDISPSQVNKLCNCKILFVFDFQQNIENAVPRIKDRGLNVCKVTPAPGMCIPDTYLSVTGQVAAALSQKNPHKKSLYQERLKEIEKRLENLTRKISSQMENSGLKNTNVITSRHQEKFAKWIGLNPVAAFASQDTITPAQINNALKEAADDHAKLVIANKQEGTELAQTLAEHLKIKHVVFSNFPLYDRQNDTTPAFDGLMQENINNLFKAMEK